MSAPTAPESPLDDTEAALRASLHGTAPDQTIDLVAAAHSPALTPLRVMLDALRVAGPYPLTAVAINRTRDALTLTGNGQYGLAGSALAPVPIAATLSATAAGTSIEFELALAVTAPYWTFDTTFPTLPPTLEQDPEGSGLIWADSVLAHVVVQGATFVARGGCGTLRLRGLLQPDGPLAAYADWLSPWPLELDGDLVLGADASQPISLDLRGIAAGSLLDITGPVAVRELGIALRAVTGLDPEVAQRDSFSELDLIGTLSLTDTITVHLTAPLRVSSTNWVLSAQIEHGPPLSGGLQAIAALFGMPVESLTVPPGLSGFDTFRLTEVEAVLRRRGGASIPDELRTLAITIESPEPWRPPVPGLRLVDVGTRWLLARIRFEEGGDLTPVVSGSVFGSIAFGAGEKPPTLDLAATLPHFVLTGSLREDTPIDVATALQTLLGRTEPPDFPNGMQVTELNMIADPAGQTYGADAAMTMDWQLPFFANLSLTELRFHVEAHQSHISGGIGGRLVLRSLTDQDIAVLALDAELPPGPGAGWVFSGGLEPGYAPTVRELVEAFVGSTPPQAFQALTVARLEGRIDTGDSTWSLAGAVAARFPLSIAGTTVEVAAGAEIELAVATAEAAPTGRAKASFGINRLSVELSGDIGVPFPSYALAVHLGDAWLLATISSGADHHQEHRVIALQLGGITLGEILEQLIRLAAPTLDFRLDPPWDELLAIDLSCFTLTIDPTESLIGLTYTVDADLVLLRLHSVGVRYRYCPDGENSVELEVSGDLLGRPYRGPDALRWDVVHDPPPDVPGKGGQLIELRYLALGQRIRLSGSPPATVTEAITRLSAEMQPRPGTDVDPVAGSRMEFDPASGWLIALDVSVLDTVDLALVFNDPNVYGLSIALRGERAGPLAGLTFEILYKRLAGGVGMFRAELALPEAFRHIELGGVSITLAVAVVEVYTNGNFLIDLGFPHNRDFERSFAVEVFPFIGRGGVYFGVLDGAASTRVPAIVGGTFSPVLELGIGLAIGVGKDITIGPLSGGIYVQTEVIFQGVLAWYQAEGGTSSARYHYAQGVAAIHGRLYGEVDFAVVKASVSIEAYVQVGVTFEAYRATVFALEVAVEAEAEIEILGLAISFSFSFRYSADFRIGADSAPPWALAADQPSQAPLRRAPERLAAIQHAAAAALTAGRVSSACWEQETRVFETPKTITAYLLPVFTIAGPPVRWADGTCPPTSEEPNPDWQVAFSLFAADGSPAGARTARAAAAPESVRAEQPPAAVLVEALLRRALAMAPGHESGKVTAGSLAWLEARLADPEWTKAPFSPDALKTFFKNNLVVNISGTDDVPTTGAMALPVPPFVTITLTPGGRRDLTLRNRSGPLYFRDAAAYMADFSPVTGAPGSEPVDDDPAEYRSISSSIFCDWCLMVTREAVRQAAGTLVARTVAMADGSLDALAADDRLLPRDTVTYVVRAGDSVAAVAAWLGATTAELTALNPGLAEQLSTVTPGDSLEVTVGVTGATLATENADVALATGAVVDVKGIRVQVRACDSLDTVSMRLYGAADPTRLVADAALSDKRVLLAGATVVVPSRSAPLPGVTNADLVAGIVYVRYFADISAPLAGWYAQRIADLNSSLLSESPVGEPLPAGLTLLVPDGPMHTTATTYTTVAGDTLLRIGAGLSLAQSPSAYADPAWIRFRAEVVRSESGVTVPACDVAVLPGETLDALAGRLVTTTTTLVGWLAEAPVLDPLSVLTIFSLPFTAGTAYPTLAAIAMAAGLTVTDLGSRPEITEAQGLFAVGTPLTVAQLPAQSVETLVAETCSGTRLSDLSHQVSRSLLQGTRLPEPTTDGGHVRGTGPLTALAELSGQQLPAPPLDGVTPLHATVAKTDPDDPDLDWLVLDAERGAGTVDYSWTNSELAAHYPDSGLTITPENGPDPIAVVGEVPRTYGLDHRIELQSASVLPIPGASGSAGGNATLWPFPASVLAKARTGDTTPFDLFAAPHTSTDVSTHTAIPDSTFATRVALPVRRVPGTTNVYEVLGADETDRDLLSTSTGGAMGVLSPGTHVALAIAPVPGSADPTGLAVPAVDPHGTFLIRTDLATDTPPGGQVVPTAASLSEPGDFLALLWQGSGARRGTFLHLETVQGDDLPPGAIAQDGTLTLWVIAIAYRQQAAAPEGRALLRTDNCALVGPGLDATRHALYLEAHDAGRFPAELVRQAIVPPGAAGITLTIPRPPSPDGSPYPAQARLAQRFSLLTTSLSGVYHAARTAPPLPPLREDGLRLPLWVRHRQARAARASGASVTDPSTLPVELWRYEQVVPVASFGPPSVAPDVPGLPPPASDPYRGFGAADALADATFGVGFQDVLGNVSAEPFGKHVTVRMGYTDPVIGLRSWPATTATWSVARPAADVIASITVRPQPAAVVPAPGAPPGPAAVTASGHAVRFAQVYLQLVQPTLRGSLLSPLATGAHTTATAVPLLEGTAPLVRYAAAWHLFATAAAALEPASTAGIGTLADVITTFGTSAESIAAVNTGTALSCLVTAGQPLSVTAATTVQLGDTATSISARVPAGSPSPSPATLLAAAANANGPAMTPGTVLTVPETAFAVGAEAAVLTLADIAGEHATSPVLLAVDNPDVCVLAAGFTISALGHTVVVGAQGASFADVRREFACDGVEVTIGEIAAANGDEPGIFAPGSRLQTTHVVAGESSTLASLAGGRLDQVAALNVDVRNPYPPGTVLSLGTWSPAPLVPSEPEPLSQVAMRLSTSPGALLAANTSLTLSAAHALVVPGAVVLPAEGIRIPYGILADDTLTTLAAQFGTDALSLARSNRDMPAILVAGRTVTVRVDDHTYSTTTVASDTLDTVSQRLAAQSNQIDFAAVVAAIADVTGLLAIGGLLVCPATSLRSKTGSASATMTATDVAAAYGVDAVSFAQANAALVGVLAHDVTLTEPSGKSEVTVARDTLNAVLSRFSARGVTVDIEGLLKANSDVPLYRGGAHALLPPSAATVSANTGPAAGPFTSPAFPFTCALRLQRDAAVIDPALRTPDNAGPVERADAVVPAPSESGDGQPRTLDTFIDACLRTLPNLRLATTSAIGEAPELWAVDFGTHGVSSVAITAPVSYPGKSGTAPRCLALRPLYPDPQSRTDVPVPILTDTGELSETVPASFGGVDVEAWARRLLSDLDLYVSAQYACGMYAHAASREGLQSLLALRRRIGRAMSAGLAPVLVGTDVGDGAAGAEAAARELTRVCDTSLADAYDIGLAVQYDTTAVSRYPDPPQPTARLHGAARADTDPTGPGATFTDAPTALGPTGSFATFFVTVANSEHRKEIETRALGYVVHSLEQDMPTSASTTDARAGRWLTFVQPLTGAYATRVIEGDLGSLKLPVPLRPQPSLPLIIAQTAAPTSPESPPSLAAAALWTFALTYSHEHAAQDEVVVTVRFNLPGAAAVKATNVASDLAAALGCYAALADRIREAMGAYTRATPSSGADVRDHIARSAAELITPIATAWEQHWSPRASALADEGANMQTYRFRVTLSRQPDDEARAETEPAVVAVTLALDSPPQPSPTGAWPEVAWRADDGSFIVLRPDPEGPHEGRLHYLPPEPIRSSGTPTLRIGWPGLNAATIQNGRASLVVYRNEHLVDDVVTDPAFVMRTAPITAPDVAAPMLAVAQPLTLVGDDLGAALTAALAELFGTAAGPPVTVQLAYGHDLVGEIRSWWPVALYPHQPLAPGIATAVAIAADAWKDSARPNPKGASWSVSLTLSSDLPGRTSRPLLVVDRMVYVAPVSGEGRPEG